MIDVWLLLNTNMKSWSPLQTMYADFTCGAPSRKKHYNVVFDQHLYKVVVALTESTSIICLQRPIAEITLRRRFRLIVELDYIGNRAW